MNENAFFALLIVLLFVDCKSDEWLQARRYEACVAHHHPNECHGKQ